MNSWTGRSEDGFNWGRPAMSQRGLSRGSAGVGGQHPIAGWRLATAENSGDRHRPEWRLDAANDAALTNRSGLIGFERV